MFSQSLMVSVGVSKLGRTGLIFVEPGVRVNGAYYRDVLLLQHMLPDIRHIGGEFFIFQQDSDAAHQARETIRLLERETPVFISPDLWPPNSPDFNPVDYKIWDLIQQRFYQTKVQNMDGLRQRLIDMWNGTEQGVIAMSLSSGADVPRVCSGQRKTIRRIRRPQSF